MVASKVKPVDSISLRRMWSTKVQPVEIGGVAIFVPPGSFKMLGKLAS